MIIKLPGVFKQVRTYLIVLAISFPSTLLAQIEDEMTAEWSGEVRLLNENTSGLPGGRADLERSRLFLWLELDSPINDNFTFGASLYGNLGTDEKKDNRWNLDNSPSNTGEINQIFLDWNYSETGFVRAGRQNLPVKMSSMVWDTDISTIGLSVNYNWLNDQESEFQLTAGNYVVEHLFSQDSHLSLADFHFTMPVNDLFISSGIMFMQVSDTDFLLTDNVQRTNTAEALQKGFDIAIVDLKFNFLVMNQSIEAGIEASENLAMDDANKAYRVNLIVGDNAVEGGWQFSLHYQDIERDASIAAYVEDDWWFATWMNGYRFSTSYGISEDMFVQVSYFDEKLQSNNTKRVFLELRSFF